MIERWGVADDGGHVHIVGDRLERLGDVWPPVGLRRVEAPDGPVERTLTVRDAGLGAVEVEIDGAAASGQWDRLESELALFAADRLHGAIAIHAAVIVAGDRALVLPGPSHAGKSSLAHAAWRAGATVASDEFALVSLDSGLVAGWRRPLRMRGPDGSVDRLDVVSDHGPVPPGLVAVLSYDRSRGDDWKVIAPSEAVLRILANTVSARTRPDEAFDAACRLAEAVAVVEGTRGEAPRTIQLLLERMEQPPDADGESHAGR